jgi:hypothetical protein
VAPIGMLVAGGAFFSAIACAIWLPIAWFVMAVH